MKRPELTARVGATTERLKRLAAGIRRWGTVGASATAVVAAVGFGGPPLWRWVTHHPYFAIAEISVNGHGRVTREDVMNWGGIQFGTSTWDVDLGAIRTRLEQQTWIQRADVAIEMPDRLTVKIHERKPIAIARLESLYYVDRYGHLLATLRDEDSRDFPIITGIDARRGYEHARWVLPRAAQLIRWCERRKCFDAISEVRVDHENSMALFPMQPPVAVMFGRGQWRDKLQRLTRVFEAYKGSEQKLASIDLSTRGSVVVKLKEGAGAPPPTGKQKGTKV